jgi:hypothetical protein
MKRVNSLGVGLVLIVGALFLESAIRSPGSIRCRNARIRKQYSKSPAWVVSCTESASRLWKCLSTALLRVGEEHAP